MQGTGNGVVSTGTGSFTINQDYDDSNGAYKVGNNTGGPINVTFDATKSGREARGYAAADRGAIREVVLMRRGVDRIGASIAAAIWKPACSNPSDRPPAPAKRSTPIGFSRCVHKTKIVPNALPLRGG